METTGSASSVDADSDDDTSYLWVVGVVCLLAQSCVACRADSCLPCSHRATVCRVDPAPTPLSLCRLYRITFIVQALHCFKNSNTGTYGADTV